MPKRDFMQVARGVVEQASGEQMDGKPLTPPPDRRNPHYNFCRVHSTLRVTPAMEAGIRDHVWSLDEMCTLMPRPSSATTRIDNGLVLKALGEKVG